MVMDPMRWLRKHNKKILTFLVVFIAVMFTLPSIMGRNRSGRQRSMVIGHYDVNGKTEELTNLESYRAGRELEILDHFGLNLVLAGMSQEKGSFSPSALMDLGVSPETTDMLDRLLSSRRGITEEERDYILNSLQASGQEDEDLAAELDSYVAMSKSEAGRYYALLIQEAIQEGFAATPEQLERVFTYHHQMLANEQFPMLSVEEVCRRDEITETGLQRMIGNYLMVLRYAEAMTGGPAVSERQLRLAIRDDKESETIAGTYVTFSAGMFLEDMKEPTETDIAAHFQQYKENVPGRTQKDNAFGFGYKLPDRAKLEYIRVNVQQIHTYYKEQFEAQTPVQREAAVRKYWEDNKKQFSRRLPPAEDKPEAQPEFYDPPFDEVAEQAQSSMLQRQAKEKAEAILNTARQMSQTASGTTLEVLTAEQRREKASDYNQIAAALAAQVEQELGRTIEITAAQTNYVSAEDLDKNDSPLRNVRQTRRNQMSQTLSQLVFRAQPFRPQEGEKNSSALGFYEDVVDLFNGLSEGYMARIIATDAARVAVSPMDDGTLGPAPAAASAESRLRQQMAEDIKRVRAFEQVQAQAKSFAEAAAKDWSEALKQTNDQLRKDPNQPGPLQERTLEQIHQRIEQYRQIQYQYVQEQIRQHQEFLRQVVKVAHQAPQVGVLPVMTEEAKFVCHVFKDFQSTPPTQQEYLRRKPLAAMFMSKVDPRLLLAHFSPRNIDRRMKYVQEEPGEAPSVPAPMEPSPLDDMGDGPI